jgi:carbamoyltransferase
LTVRDLSHERHATPLHAPGADWSHPRSRDIAFGVQALTLEAGLALVRACRSLTGYHTLAFAGGLAQNGYLCTAARREGSFRDIFVPPAVYDGGLAAGCALFACHHALEVPLPGDGPGALDRIGMAYPRERCAAAVASIGGREVDREEAIEAAARTIAEGAVVAWFEGRSEHGPRALGSRSFLCRADDVALKDRVNATVKFRESFRPLAPVVPQEVAGDYFDIDWPSPYMMYIANGIESARDAVAGALHVDGSARLQTVAGDHSLRHIALRVGELVGVPMVINTSFNVRAPIVETPEDAVETALSVPVGLLYLDGMLAAPHG